MNCDSIVILPPKVSHLFRPREVRLRANIADLQKTPDTFVILSSIINLEKSVQDITPHYSGVLIEFKFVERCVTAERIELMRSFEDSKRLR